MPQNDPISGAGVSPATSPGEVECDWNQAVAREIALGQTLVDDAILTDLLGGPRVQLISPDGRDLYIRRCTKEAGKRGHPCSPADLPFASNTTVEEVGDALFRFARP